MCLFLHKVTREEAIDPRKEGRCATAYCLAVCVEGAGSESGKPKSDFVCKPKSHTQVTDFLRSAHWLTVFGSECLEF
jgi:hypothetical protein